MTAFITLWLLQNNLRWFGKKQFKISRPSHAASFFASFSYWWKQRALTDDKCTVNMSSFYLFTKRPLRFRIDVIFIYTATLWDVHKKEKSNKTWRLSIYYFSLYWAWNVYVCVTTHVYVQFYIQEYLFVCICVCFCEGVLPYGKCVCVCACVCMCDWQWCLLGDSVTECADPSAGPASLHFSSILLHFLHL